MTPGLAALLCTCLLVLVAALLAASEVADHRMAERVRRAAAGNAAAPPWRGVGAVMGSMLRRLDLWGVVRWLSSPEDRIQVERTLAPLGVPAPLAAPLLVAVKILFLLGAPAAALGYHYVLSPDSGLAMPLVASIGIGVMGPNFLLAQIRKRRLATMNRGMADTLDLLVVCAEAGLGLESAIDRVASDLRRANPSMALEFALLSQEMRMMPDRSQAMERFAQRAEVEGLKRVAATLSQAMRYGTPLGQALRTLAGEERNARMIRLEEKAARLPSLLVLPLILFILPPLFMILVGPSALTLIDAFGAF